MWAKLDDALLDHRKILEAGRRFGRNGRATALGFYTGGLLYTNKHLTDGFLPESVVEGLRLVERPLQAAEVMVDVGLWERVAGGFCIHDYAAYNPSADEVRAARAWDRRRKELYSDPDLLASVRVRDRERCRYCGQKVNWKDRRGAIGGQYDHIRPSGPNTLENIVVSCRGCTARKKYRAPDEAGMALLPPGAQGNGYESV